MTVACSRKIWPPDLGEAIQVDAAWMRIGEVKVARTIIAISMLMLPWTSSPSCLTRLVMTTRRTRHRLAARRAALQTHHSVTDALISLPRQSGHTHVQGERSFGAVAFIDQVIHVLGWPFTPSTSSNFQVVISV